VASAAHTDPSASLPLNFPSAGDIVHAHHHTVTEPTFAILPNESARDSYKSQSGTVAVARDHLNFGSPHLRRKRHHISVQVCATGYIIIENSTAHAEVREAH
jgi:hypothetical protein